MAKFEVPAGWTVQAFRYLQRLAASPLGACPTRPDRLARPSSVSRVRQRAAVVRDNDNPAANVAFAAPSAAVTKALARNTSRRAPDCD